jgi:hypothetical protein
MKKATLPSVLFGTLVFAAPTWAQQPAADPAPPPEKRPVSEQDLHDRIEKERASLEAREKRIGAELDALDRAALKDGDWAKEWAGTYYTGDGLGMNVSISVAPKGGLAYTWHGCLGLYDANHGDIVETFPDGLKVKLAIDPSASQYRYLSLRLYFVRWGDRRYLVPEAQMTKLVNNYNEGSFARDAMYSIPRKHEKDENVHRRTPTPPGKPVLPPEFDKLLITAPITLKVTRVAPNPEKPVTNGVKVLQVRVDLDGGSNRAVFRGMEIAYESGFTFGTIRIDTVNETTSSGVLTIFGGDNEKLNPPAVGTELKLPRPEPELPVEPPGKR